MDHVLAKITIELTAEVPRTGSAMTRLGTDAHVFRKEIPEIIWKGKSGKEHARMGDTYRVTGLRIEQPVSE